MNEDRARFLSTLGLGYCSSGNHATHDAFLYDNVVWCPQHLPPGKPQDPPASGLCAWGKGHWADRLWLTPRDGKWYCLPHLMRIVKVATWMP